MNSNMYIAILGRQPLLGVAELERRFGAAAVTPLGESAALLQTDQPVDIDTLGGSVKIAHVVSQTASNGWLGVSKQTVKYLLGELSHHNGKVTLGFSAYGFKINPRDVQKTGLVVKARLKNTGGSIRLIPNTETALSSAQVFHNKLAGGGTKRELILVNGNNGRGYIAETIGVQDIDSYTLRDRGRPKRDALNGMLPPKLAQIMVNLGSYTTGTSPWVLDPFCGTGVVLQEASLIGDHVYGSDLNPKMAEFTEKNMDWFLPKFTPTGVYHGARQADATTEQWPELEDGNPHAIVSETYLGEPMAQEPTPEKLAKVMSRCEEVIRGFLANIAPQLESGAPLCIAIPAWRIKGEIKHLPVVDDLSDLGYNWIDFEHVSRSDLIYYREDQIVARELLVITKK